MQLVFRIFKLYQPGGLNEKSTILNNLTQTTAAKSAAEAGEMLRQWRRQLLRARELGLHVPDPLLQVNALSEVMRIVVVKEHQAYTAHCGELPADVDRRSGSLAPWNTNKSESDFWQPKDQRGECCW